MSSAEFYGIRMGDLFAMVDVLRKPGFVELVTKAVDREVHALLDARAHGWDEEKRYEYPLDEDSVVWDVGAYEGEFTDKILDKFGCTVRMFEVLPRLNKELKKKYREDTRVTVADYGLSGDSDSMFVLDVGTRTSLYRTGRIKVGLKRPSGVFKDDDPITLLKLNVEGEEYSILEELIISGRIARVKYLQIQYHDLIVLDDEEGLYQAVPDAVERQGWITQQLVKTHQQQWCWPWTWESWCRR